jgi:hypothetical protein
MEWDRKPDDDVGSRDFRFAVTGMAIVIALALVATIISQL